MNAVKWIGKNNFNYNLKALIKAAGKKIYYADDAILLYLVQKVFEESLYARIANGFYFFMLWFLPFRVLCGG